MAVGGSRKELNKTAHELVFVEARRRRSNRGFIDIVAGEPKSSATHDEDRKLPETLGCLETADWWRALEGFDRTADRAHSATP
jgi:hypothetical protein